MKLTHGQKKFIKRNLRKLTVSELSQKLSVSEDELKEYLQKKGVTVAVPAASEDAMNSSINDRIASFSFRQWLAVHWPYVAWLVFIVLVAYTNAVWGKFVSDDVEVFSDPNISRFDNVFHSPFIFLRTFFYFILYNLGGGAPFVFKLFNIVFHIGSVVTAYAILTILSGGTIAFIAAVIMAAHPLLTEAVTWISGGVYVQYSFFLLVSFLFYLLGKNNKKYMYASVAAFILGLFSSEKALIFPGIIFAYEMALGSLKRRWKQILPFGVLSVIWAFRYFTQVGERIEGVAADTYSTPDMSLYNPLLQWPVAITTYLQLFLWPFGLTIYHSETIVNRVEYAVRSIALLVSTGLALYSWKRNRMIFFMLSFFVIALLPVLTPLKIAWIVAERYVYLGSVGLAFVAAYGLNFLYQRTKHKGAAAAVFALLVCSLMVRTIVRNNDWRDEDHLWIATDKHSPSSAINHNNLGDVYGRQGDHDRSIAEFKKAIEINPYYGDAYHNLGNAYRNKKDYKNALAAYAKALTLNPGLWQSHENIAVIYFEQKRYEESQKHLLEAYRIAPQNAEIVFNLAVVTLAKGDKEKAAEYFLMILRLDPDNAAAKAGYAEATK